MEEMPHKEEGGPEMTEARGADSRSDTTKPRKADRLLSVPQSCSLPWEELNIWDLPHKVH